MIARDTKREREGKGDEEGKRREETKIPLTLIRTNTLSEEMKTIKRSSDCQAKSG